ncbi:HpcH/HpaI aldolase/citrate lyase family protein [Parasphingorhabdus sp.]|uniref:HpcH/HpaI aldolase/citrate lyase family protein n=1 Tax=Parasphingorhabdus sp. TaxID=2709688 RepID=UPI003A924CF1
MMRSLLFVPGDSERKLAKSADTTADIVILDLEDAVAKGQKPTARALVASHLTTDTFDRSSGTWVRINALDTADALLDLRAAMPGQPNGIVLPKTEGPEDIRLLDHYLTALEAEHGISKGATEILPIVTETPKAVFRLGDYAGCSSRLAGLTWGGEDLATAIGANQNKNGAGDWLDPYRLVRSLTLFGASAAGTLPIDAVFTNFRDPAGLRRSCNLARRDGFVGKLAIHPDQVAIINEAFTPTDDELKLAQDIVALFDRNPGAGVLELEGEMIDAPHLTRARALLGLNRS